jgi:hypothetical protein
VEEAAVMARRSGAAVAFAAVVVAWLAGTAPQAAKTDIHVEFDPKFSFAALHTWAWHPDGAGDVKLALSADSDPKRVAAVVDPVIVPAVEREMAARKWSKATGGAPDVYVHYYFLATVGQTSQYAGQFLPAVPVWGLPPFAPMTTSLDIYPVGTLIIDLTSPSLKAIVWRGSAAREIEIERPAAERRKTLDRAVRDLVAKFPPKK